MTLVTGGMTYLRFDLFRWIGSLRSVHLFSLVPSDSSGNGITWRGATGNREGALLCRAESRSRRSRAPYREAVPPSSRWSARMVSDETPSRSAGPIVLGKNGIGYLLQRSLPKSSHDRKAHRGYFVVQCVECVHWDIGGPCYCHIVTGGMSYLRITYRRTGIGGSGTIGATSPRLIRF